jgi:hypothetical protein
MSSCCSSRSPRRGGDSEPRRRPSLVHGTAPRARLLRAARLLPLVIAALLVAVSAAAQEPPDTLATPPRLPPADTLTEGQDTVAARRPLVRFPVLPPAPVGGPATGVWVWDRAALLREAPVSLADLLERIPGIATYRAGMFVQPEAAAGFGGTAGRVEVEVDGFVLDPLAASVLDLSQLALGHLREVRVERRLGLLRIRLLTEAPDNDQPYTRIEAGIGLPTANLFRGQFLVPHAVIGPLGVAVERLDTEGTNRNEPADVFSAWAKWAYTTDERGVQLELRRSTLRRRPASPWPGESFRQDLVLRARNRFAPALLGELYAGRSLLEETLPATAGDTLVVPDPSRDSFQAGARMLYQVPQLALAGAVRYRSAEFLPAIEGVLEADATVGPASLSVIGGYAAWRDQDGAPWFNARAELRPVPFAAAFAEVTGGRRGAPLPADTVLRSVLTERSGWRAGLSAAIGDRASGSVAAVGLDQDMAHPFGLPFDSAAAPLPAEPIRGMEAHGRLVLWPGWLAIESWITDWGRNPGWPWLPARSWRTALELHSLPLPTGNLELVGRLEALHRSGVIAFAPAAPPGEPTTVAVPGFTQVNGYIHIRVIDVRAFIGWQDILGQNIEVLPGRVHRGPRLMYGVKWSLWN